MVRENRPLPKLPVRYRAGVRPVRDNLVHFVDIFELIPSKISLLIVGSLVLHVLQIVLFAPPFGYLGKTFFFVIEPILPYPMMAYFILEHTKGSTPVDGI